MAAQESGAPLTATRAFLANASETGKAALSRQRPWSELLDRNSFNKPESISDVKSRMRKNLLYFQMNYVVLTAVLVGISLLRYPGSLVVLLVLAAAWFFLYFSRTEPLVVFNRSYGDKEVLVVLVILTFISIFWTNTGSTIFTALAMSIALVALHAAFRTPDDLFLDEPDYASNSYLTFQPPVVNRV